MTRSRRWSLAAVAIALVVGLPLAVRSRPVRAPDTSAAEVLAQVRAEAHHPYSGRVETVGNLDLPVTSRFTDVGALLGERTTLRVWWRAADAWRVDKLLVAGEADLVHDGDLTTEWRYEAARAVRSIDPDVRLPRSEDLLPPVLAARVVESAEIQPVTRVDARRIAGIAAPGIRIRPADARSSVDHVDLWADPDSGVVLRLDVYADGDTTPSFTTAFTSFSSSTPPAARTRFVRPGGVAVSFEDVVDIADAANQYAPYTPPDSLAGLARAATPQGAVGVYGSGLTRLLVIPLRHGDAHTLQDQIERSAGATVTEAGSWFRSGPLGVLVSERRDRSWLLAGLLTEETMLAAEHDLRAGALPR